MGQKYAAYDAAGAITGFFDTDINPASQIPAQSIEITEAQWLDCISNPGQRMVDVINKVIINTPAPDPAVVLKNNQDIVWQKIKDERDRRSTGGALVTVQGAGKWFHSDAASRVQQLGLKDSARDAMAAGGAMTDPILLGGTQIMWKCMDESFIGLTNQVAFDIVAAMKQLDGAAFNNAEKHRQAMLQAPDPLAYDYSTGWPTIYGG